MSPSAPLQGGLASRTTRLTQSELGQSVLTVGIRSGSQSGKVQSVQPSLKGVVSSSRARLDRCQSYVSTVSSLLPLQGGRLVSHAFWAGPPRTDDAGRPTPWHRLRAPETSPGRPGVGGPAPRSPPWPCWGRAAPDSVQWGAFRPAEAGYGALARRCRSPQGLRRASRHREGRGRPLGGAGAGLAAVRAGRSGEISPDPQPCGAVPKQTPQAVGKQLGAPPKRCQGACPALLQEPPPSLGRLGSTFRGAQQQAKPSCSPSHKLAAHIEPCSSKAACAEFPTAEQGRAGAHILLTRFSGSPQHACQLSESGKAPQLC